MKLAAPARRTRRLLAGFAAVLALGWMGVRARAYVDLALGYAAKVAGSAVFVGGRTLADVRADELSGLPGLWDWIELVRTPDGVEAHAFGLVRRARSRLDLGVTLVAASDRALSPDAGPGRTPRSARPTPAVVTPTAELAPVLAAGFDADAAAGRRTRAVVVRQHGRLVGERYGPGYGPDSVLPGWSMTKSLVGAVIGILVRDGRLEVFGPAEVPEWCGACDARGVITVDQLLRMSSGLEFVEEYDDPDADAVAMLFGADDMAAFAAAQPLAGPPGSVFHYSSGTTNILSRLILGRFDGSTARGLQFIRDELFEPLGMERALIELDAVGTPVGSSFGHATARGWARFGQLLLDDGVVDDGSAAGRRVLPEGWVAYAATPTPPAAAGEYGAHLWLNAGPEGRPDSRPLPDVPPDTLMARGYAGQLLAVVPSRGAVILRLGADAPDADFDRNAFLADILDALPDSPPESGSRRR